MLAASSRLTCSRFPRASTLATTLASLIAAASSVVTSSGCGSAARDGLFDSHAGASGAAGTSSAAGAAAGSGGLGGASGAPGGSSGAGGGDGIGGGGSSGGVAGSSGSGSSGSGNSGSGNVPDGDAGVDAAVGSGAGDASAANRLGCAEADQADCDALAASLAHRYSFVGNAASVLDGVGLAHGSVVNGQLSGSGSVLLSGAESPENYVNLPNGLVSSLGSGTFEAWLQWGGGDPWQRIFDFGSSQTGEDVRAGGEEYLFLTPRSSDDTVRATFLSSETVDEVQVNGAAPLPSGVVSHVAVVVDGQAGTLALFINGALASSAALPSSLVALAGDNNNWLGRSEFPTDPGFAGSLLELRVYSAPLSAAQLALSFQLGPDAAVNP
ncbi:MAG: hypothetical protein RL033_6974 [Pseudomonadota bacterium]